jgi:hypothetical protein
VSILAIAGPAAGQPIGSVHAQIRTARDADAMADQHGRRTACAVAMGVQEGDRGGLVLGVIASLARRWALPVAGAGMLALRTDGDDAAT